MKTKLLTLLAIIIATASFAQTFTVDNLNYEVISTNPNEVSITGGNITGDLVIPENVSDGGTFFTVTSVGDSAFKGKLLTAVTFPATIKTIADQAFRNNQFTSLTLPEGVTSIGFLSFQGSPLTSLSLPTSLISIGELAFVGAPLTSITLPEGIVTIGDNAFRDNQLTSLTIPSTVTSIGARAFEANNLVSITLSEGLITIDEQAFINNQLTNLTLPSTVTSIGARAFEGNDLTAINSQATTAPSITTGTNDSFGDNRISIDLTIPPGTEAAYETATWTGFRSINGVVNIQVGTTFTDNNFDYRITSITPNEVEINGGSSIPSSLVLPQIVSFEDQSYTLVSVGGGAFEGADLTSVTFPNTIRTIEATAFKNNEIANLSLPNSLISIGVRAFQINAIAGALVIPNSVTSIGNASFEANQISSIVISENITNLGNNTFRVNSLTSITIPANVTRLGNTIFGDNPLTEVITLGNNPPSIESASTDSFFQLRPNIALTVPDNTKEAYESAGWTGFRNINGDLALGATFIDNGLSYIVTSLTPNEVQITGGGTLANTALVIPEDVTSEGSTFTVTSVGDSAFKDSLLASVTFPETIITIADQAFRNNQFTSLTLPEGLTSIGDLSFQGSPITSLNLPESLTSIGGNAFVGAALTSLTLPEELLTIGEQAFRNNQLTNLTLPSKVTSVGARAFETNNLIAINSQANTPPAISTGADDSFGNNRDSIDLTVPQGSEVAYEDATWIGFNSINGIRDFEIGDTFIDSDLNYTVTSLTPNEVQITGGTPTNTALVVPEDVTSEGSTFSVTSVGDSAFKDALLTAVTFPETIITIEDSAFQDNAITSLNLPESLISIGVSAFLNNSITSLTLSEGLVTIGNNAFLNNQLTNLTLPSTVTSIGTHAFEDTPLTSIAVNANTPPSIEEDSFSNRNTIALTVPTSTELDYLLNGWDGFTTINGENDTVFTQFEVDNINYTVTSLNPNEVATTISSINGVLTVPETVVNNNVTYIVTAIGNNSFSGNILTSVNLPNTITSIGTRAFQANTSLTSITIPRSVTNISQKAFQSGAASVLTTVIVEAVIPPNIDTRNDSHSFNTRANIDLFVPTGTTQAYEAAGWIDFKSITEFNVGIFVAPKIFLQGAATNPNTDEENLMRDDLRVANLIPTASPYEDAVTIDTSVFETEGENAIVDWVFVELRDDNNDIVASKSALLQRDGDVVAINGTSNLSFNVDNDDYFVVIQQRNHLGVKTANMMSLSAATSFIDFTNDPTLVEGDDNALIEVSEGLYALIAGDFDENGQIQPSDVNETTSAIGTSSYSNADMDMNGQIQPADVNNLVNPNVGRGVQF